MRTRGPVAATAAAAVMVLAACVDADPQQSMLDPQGPNARAVDGHWQTMLLLGSLVWLVVMALVVVAVFRRRSNDPAADRRGPVVVAVAGAALPALVVIGVLAQSIAVEREVRADVEATDAVVVDVTAKQYWWEVRYPDDGVVTANEIHVPTGRTVRLHLTTDDVIHSLWVPQLSGKLDMVPGSTNVLHLEADAPGLYWGQCAEFCGLQHANMRFAVVAHEPAEYADWLERQARPAETSPTSPGDPTAPAEPEDDGGPYDTDEPRDVDGDDGTDEGGDEDAALVASGRDVFMSSSCVYCHTIAGTEARGELGPDLTHLASRQTLGAGILPNTRGNLAGWLLDPQAIKPGNAMPGTDLSGEDLEALLTYLESLE